MKRKGKKNRAYFLWMNKKFSLLVAYENDTIYGNPQNKRYNQII